MSGRNAWSAGVVATSLSTSQAPVLSATGDGDANLRLVLVIGLQHRDRQVFAGGEFSHCLVHVDMLVRPRAVPGQKVWCAFRDPAIKL